MNFSDLLTFSDYDFAFTTDSDDILQFSQVPDAQKAILSNSIGIDAIVLGSGNDFATDDSGQRIYFGNAGFDTIDGGAGSDTISSGRDGDIVTGGGDGDYLFGNKGDDIVDGGAGDDFLFGGQDNDVLTGGDGNDALYGDLGDDTLNGGTGINTLTGGAGSDLFLLEYSSGGNPQITDFDLSQDRLGGINLAANDLEFRLVSLSGTTPAVQVARQVNGSLEVLTFVTGSEIQDDRAVGQVAARFVTIGDVGETNTGGSTGETNTGGSTGETNTGGSTGETNTGGSTGETNTGGSTGETNTGGSTGETNTGGSTGETNTGGSTGGTNTGGSTGGTNTGGSTGGTNTGGSGSSGGGSNEIAEDASTGSDLGDLTNELRRTRMDSVASFGLATYAFSMGDRGVVSIDLTGLSQDVNLFLLRDENANGIWESGSDTQLTGSFNAGTAAETISSVLDPGSYLVLIGSGSARPDATDYTFKASAINVDRAIADLPSNFDVNYYLVTNFDAIADISSPAPEDLAAIAAVHYDTIGKSQGRRIAPSVSSTFNIDIDYSFDTSGFFNARRRQVMETAANLWESVIFSEFENIAAGTTIAPFNPNVNGSPDITLSGEIDDLRIFAAPFTFSGNTAGQIVKVVSRPGASSQPMYTTMLINTGSDPQLSTVLHEMGHALGINDGSNNGGFFGGDTARSINNGNLIPAANATHISESFRSVNGAAALMTPSGGAPLPTEVDLAILADRGYRVAGFNV
jgi:hypothetical protein